MKYMNKIIPLLVALPIIFLTSCIKDKFNAPTQNIPHVDFAANTTIAAFKATFSGTLDSIKQDIIIKGTVISSDEAGNIYKALYIQDSTGGLVISLDKTNLYTTLQPGQRVFIKCKGLYLGAYGGVTQLGFVFQGAIGRIPDAMINSHIFPDSLPGAIPTPLSKTISSISGNDLCMRIRLDNLHFETIGTEFASQLSNSTNITLDDDNGNTIILYNSKYANFAGKLTPKGKGSVNAILSSFNGKYQLYINSLNDLFNWNDTAPVMRDIINEPFTSTFGSFTTNNVTGTEAWSITSYGATMSGYTGGNHTNEDWLISPSVNLDNYSDEVLSFSTSMNYGTAGDGSLRLFYSTNYIDGNAPSTATWTEITGFTLSSGAWAVTPSGNINISGISGSNVHIAFKYTSTTSSAATWEISNFKVTALSIGK
jgi:hypothetical protein